MQLPRAFPGPGCLRPAQGPAHGEMVPERAGPEPAAPGRTQPGPGKNFFADVDKFKNIFGAWESRLRRNGAIRSVLRGRVGLAGAPGWGGGWPRGHSETNQTHPDELRPQPAGTTGRREGMDASCSLVILEKGSAEGHEGPQGIPRCPRQRTQHPHGKP